MEQYVLWHDRSSRDELSRRVQARLKQWFAEARRVVPPTRWARELDQLLVRWADEGVLLPASYARELQQWIAREAEQASRSRSSNDMLGLGSIPAVPEMGPDEDDAPYEYDETTGAIYDRRTGREVTDDELARWDDHAEYSDESLPYLEESEVEEEQALAEPPSSEQGDPNAPPNPTTDVARLPSNWAFPSDPLRELRPQSPEEWPELGGIPIRPGTLPPAGPPPNPNDSEGSLGTVVGVGGALTGIFVEPVDWAMTAKEIYQEPRDPWSYAGLVPFVPSAAGKVGKAGKRARRVGKAGSRAVHGNSLTSKRKAYLYALYDKKGQFLKWGVTQDMNRRYPARVMRSKRIIEISRGPRAQMLRKERRFVETSPGPWNHESWAGTRLGEKP